MWIIGSLYFIAWRVQKLLPKTLMHIATRTTIALSPLLGQSGLPPLQTSSKDRVNYFYYNRTFLMGINVWYSLRIYTALTFAARTSELIWIPDAWDVERSPGGERHLDHRVRSADRYVSHGDDDCREGTGNVGSVKHGKNEVRWSTCRATKIFLWWWALSLRCSRHVDLDDWPWRNRREGF